MLQMNNNNKINNHFKKRQITCYKKIAQIKYKKI